MTVGRAVFALLLAGGAACKRPPDFMARDVAVELAATVTANPPRIALSWPTGALHEAQIVVQRKAATAPAFVGPPKAILPAGTTTWVDTDAAPGIAYDYFVERTLAENRWQSAGFLRAGLELSLVEDRGQIALVVEGAIQASLSAEIARLEEDLRGDGWIPVRVLVQRGSSPPEVKETIKALYRAAPDRLRQVLLLGHVPVAYSGNIAPDHHRRPTGNGRTPTHQGAWPADIYYGDMVGTWTDTTVDTRNNEFPPTDSLNVNIPGDGKFDQEAATTDEKRPRGAHSLAPQRRGQIALAIGRVDLSELPAFSPRSEIDLLRAYLDKDHRFRQRQLVGERFAVVDDHFPIRTDAKLGRDEVPESKAVAAYSVASALFGSAAVKRGGWLDLLGAHPALFAYASGPGHHTSIEGVATTTDLAEKDPKVMFSVVWGSFFGDWEHRDNFLRAQLATSAGLTSAWGSDPWLFHPLALGATVGECVVLTEQSSPRSHLALMGDPSLRMFVVAPPTGAVAAWAGRGVSLRWGPSPDAVLGYHVYRADDPVQPVRRLTDRLLAHTTFTDAGPVPAGARYLVRAVKLEVTASGSFYNPSQAAFADAPATSRFEGLARRRSDAPVSRLPH
jgi:hypothetical protein